MSTELQARTERIVLVYNPSLQNQQTHFSTTANTFGELQADMIEKGIVNNMKDWKVMEGRTRITLEDANAILPTNIPMANKPGHVSNDLIIVMTQKKINLGAVSRSELMAEIKAYRVKSKDNEKEVKAFFGNYTQLSNEVLEKRHELFFSKKAAAQNSESKAELKEEKSPEVKKQFNANDEILSAASEEEKKNRFQEMEKSLDNALKALNDFRTKFYAEFHGNLSEDDRLGDLKAAIIPGFHVY